MGVIVVTLLFFKAGKVGTGFSKAGLVGVNGIGGGKVRFSCAFELGIQRGGFGNQGFEFGFALGKLGAGGGFGKAGITLAHQSQ